MNKSIFVIGNGESRQGFDLALLKPHGKIVGCNALCRDFHPNILIVMDHTVTAEAGISDYYGEAYARYPELCPGAKKLDPDKGWSAGPAALDIACSSLEGDVYLLGFDLYGVDGKHNNIYKGTPGYRDCDAEETFCGNWIKQMYVVFTDYPDRKFYRVGRENDPVPHEWQNLANVKFISYNEFNERLIKIK